MKLRFSDILYKYLARNFFFSFITVFICFFFIASLLESMEIIRRLSHGYNAPHTLVLKLITLKTVSTISSFFPFIIFVSTIVFYLIINNKQELTSIRGFGVPNRKIAQCLSIVTFLIGVFYISIFDTISAFSVEKVKKIESIVFQKYNQENAGITVTNSGLWFKDISENSSYIIYAKAFVQNSNSLRCVRFFQFGKNLDFQKSIHALKAQIKDGIWSIEGVIIIDSEGNKTEKSSIEIPTKLSLKNINRMTTDPKSVSLWNLTRYINMLENVGLSTLKYKMQLYIQTSSIIQMIVFVLLASIFCISYNSRDMRRYSLKVASAVILAFPIHFINNVLIAFGSNGTIHPISATLLLPITLLFFFGYYILKK